MTLNTIRKGLSTIVLALAISAGVNAAANATDLQLTSRTVSHGDAINNSNTSTLTQSFSQQYIIQQGSNKAQYVDDTYNNRFGLNLENSEWRLNLGEKKVSGKGRFHVAHKNDNDFIAAEYQWRDNSENNVAIMGKKEFDNSIAYAGFDDDSITASMFIKNPKDTLSGVGVRRDSGEWDFNVSYSKRLNPDIGIFAFYWNQQDNAGMQSLQIKAGRNVDANFALGGTTCDNCDFNASQIGDATSGSTLSMYEFLRADGQIGSEKGDFGMEFKWKEHSNAYLNVAYNFGSLSLGEFGSINNIVLSPELDYNFSNKDEFGYIGLRGDFGKNDQFRIWYKGKFDDSDREHSVMLQVRNEL